MLSIRKKLIFSFLTCGFIVIPILAILSGLLYFQLYAGHNSGYEFGYYGRFNRFQRVLGTLPNVTVIDQWQHLDISLEDFGFILLIDGGQKVQLDIWESNPIRDEKDKQKIKTYIVNQIERHVQSGNGE